MKKIKVILLLGALCLACALPSRVLADYYRYTDARGVVHITNKLNAVPAQYRATMKVTREEPKKDAGAGQASAPSHPSAENPAAQQEVPAQAQGRFAQLASRHVWVKPLLVAAALAALFLAVVKLASWLSSPLLSRVIYMTFFVGVMVFLYKTYVDYMVEGSMKIRDRAVSMIKKSSNREVPEPAGEVPAGQR